MSRTGPSGWTPALVQRLRVLWDGGAPTEAIATELRTTKNAVVGKAHRIGLAGRPSPIKPRIGPAKPRRARRAGKVTLPALASLVVSVPTPDTDLPDECCWPIGTPRAPGFRYCDAPVPRRVVYCTVHAAQARGAALQPEGA